VTIADVIQEPTTAYTVAGTTLTCTSAPADGDTIHVRFLGRVVDVANAAILQDSDQDTKIQVEESADEDIIRFDLAGAEDFTMSANSLNVLTGSVVALPDATVGAPALTNTGDLNTGIYFPAADTVGVVTGGTEQFRFGSNPTTAKNLIQNGKFEVNQRGSTDVAAGAAGYGPDRWSVISGATAAYTLTSDTSVPAGQGFLNSFKVDITTADSSISSGENYYVEHRIEGSDCRQLMLGTANAKTVTLQFWARSQVTGIHCVSLQNSAQNRSYPFEYTISSADTWEYFTETIALDTGGTWLTDTGIGLRVRWSLGAGSSYQGVGDSWEAARDDCTSNQVNAVASTGQFGLAGVQLEVGSVATDFEHEPFSVTFAKCQRYFQVVGNGAVGGARTTAVAYFGLQFSPTMRAAPSLTLIDDSVQVIDTNGSGLVSSSGSIQISNIKTTGLMFGIDGYSGGNALTQHRPHIIYNQADFLQASAEL
jgi:hypothetical protein